jgi:hypothetical protein
MKYTLINEIAYILNDLQFSESNDKIIEALAEIVVDLEILEEG